MNKDTTNTTENQNLGFQDMLTEVLREGARQMLKAAIEMESTLLLNNIRIRSQKMVCNKL